MVDILLQHMNSLIMMGVRSAHACRPRRVTVAWLSLVVTVVVLSLPTVSVLSLPAAAMLLLTTSSMILAGLALLAGSWQAHDPPGAVSSSCSTTAHARCTVCLHNREHVPVREREPLWEREAIVGQEPLWKQEP